MKSKLKCARYCYCKLAFFSSAHTIISTGYFPFQFLDLSNRANHLHTNKIINKNTHHKKTLHIKTHAQAHMNGIISSQLFTVRNFCWSCSCNFPSKHTHAYKQAITYYHPFQIHSQIDFNKYIKDNRPSVEAARAWNRRWYHQFDSKTKQMSFQNRWCPGQLKWKW